ncbi:hypothetical protein [Maridesulfovibrio frigidus]|uniref:hypothetical protein n=1 Tax=Maridesulfovibrio frigidus TaxID=340956 RepID=UPI0004E21B91|nr:hypothetical protein [Maridesulfovibrio frigidus]
MGDFKSRLNKQRCVLTIINDRFLDSSEPLFGLSQNSISRWVLKNKLDQNDKLVLLIQGLSSSLLFLANQSQQQITGEYVELENAVNRQIEGLEDYFCSEN